MNQSQNKVLRMFYACLLLFFVSSPLFASGISGGAMTINFDNRALANAFTHNTDPNRPAFYLEEYFSSSAYQNLSDAQLLTTHFVPGTQEISAIGRQLMVNGPTVSGRNKATDFSFDNSDIVGTATGVVGLGGAFRFRIDVPFNLNNGEEEGNRTIIGDFTLEYDSAGEVNGHSGWTLFNHVGWRADVFDLDNVVINLSSNNLLLTGSLALGEGVSHLGGNTGAIVGDFSFQTSVVPVPAAVWFFITGLGGLLLSRHSKRAIVL